MIPERNSCCSNQNFANSSDLLITWFIVIAVFCREICDPRTWINPFKRTPSLFNNLQLIFCQFMAPWLINEWSVVWVEELSRNYLFDCQKIRWIHIYSCVSIVMITAIDWYGKNRSRKGAWISISVNFIAKDLEDISINHRRLER